jgi:hypothetical protein
LRCVNTKLAFFQDGVSSSVRIHTALSCAAYPPCAHAPAFVISTNVPL